MNIVEPVVQWTPDNMIEVALREPDDFLKVRETLTRIGVASRKDVKMTMKQMQGFFRRSCHCHLCISSMTVDGKIDARDIISYIF